MRMVKVTIKHANEYVLGLMVMVNLLREVDKASGSISSYDGQDEFYLFVGI